MNSYDRKLKMKLTSAAGPSMASTIGKNRSPSIRPSKTSANRSLRNSRATKPNSLVASMEAASAAASAPCTTGARTDSNAKEARRRLQPIDVTKACRKNKMKHKYLNHDKSI